MLRAPAAILLLTAALSLPAGVATACDLIPGADALLRPGSLVLLGELHGTAEAPPVVAGLACEALTAGHDVIVGLELPRDGQAELEAFMAGTELASDRQRLLAGEFWQRDYQDGRTSTAMLELHERLRELAASSGRLQAVYIDEPSNPGARERAMAERILAVHAAAPESVLIVLTGNLHNRLTRGTRWNSEHEPMGYLISQLAPTAEVASIELTYGPGTAWLCQGSRASDCGVAELGGRPPTGEGIVPLQDRAGAAVTGHLHLGPIVASPPARQEYPGG